MLFSVLVVSLNPGKDLKFTVDSILKQKGVNYEVIIKDGGSTDVSILYLPSDPRIKIYSQADAGIYDAMNQATQYASGDYSLFINCGDCFYDENSLYSVAEYISRNASLDQHVIYYGDCYTENRHGVLKYPSQFDDYFCYTMVLCHQATLYPTFLLKERKYNIDYKIAADYEYYVYAYKHGYELKHIPVVIARYQGNGTSETVKNRRRAVTELQRAVKENYSKEEYRKVWLKAQLHGIGIKRFLVKQGFFYPIYRILARIRYK